MNALEHLSPMQVDNLIKSVKNMQQQIPIEMPEFGKIKDDTAVLGTHDGVEYKLHRYRHPMQNDRYSIHLRFKETNDILLRIDVNNGTHRNPDGTVIGQNHIHIYTLSDYPKDAFAYELPTDFSDLTSIFSALEQFLSYTNIQRAPS